MSELTQIIEETTIYKVENYPWETLAVCQREDDGLEVNVWDDAGPEDSRGILLDLDQVQRLADFLNEYLAEL